MRLEARPAQVYVALYDRLPHPSLGPMQEFVFDIGISATRPTVLTDVVWRVFDQNDHVALVRQRLGQAAMHELTLGQYGVAPGMGLVLPRCYFLEQGTLPLSHVRVSVAGYDYETQAAVTAVLEIPLVYHQQRAKLRLPMAGGAWWAITGNDWSSIHKADPVSWPFAYDFVRLGPEGRTFDGRGLRNEDHFCFGQPVLAPAGGKVVLVRDDMPDQPPGQPLDADCWPARPAAWPATWSSSATATASSATWLTCRQAACRWRWARWSKRASNGSRGQLRPFARPALALSLPGRP